jgi:hypothetical protein
MCGWVVQGKQIENELKLTETPTPETKPWAALFFSSVGYTVSRGAPFRKLLAPAFLFGFLIKNRAFKK